MNYYLKITKKKNKIHMEIYRCLDLMDNTKLLRVIKQFKIM